MREYQSQIDSIFAKFPSASPNQTTNTLPMENQEIFTKQKQFANIEKKSNEIFLSKILDYIIFYFGILLR